MIPGSNLLSMALQIIAPMQVTYYRYIGRTLNELGLYESSYDEGSLLWGSLQSVPRNLYEQFGLDLTKVYYNFYASKDMLDVTRNVSGDQIAYNGQRFQCESATNWYAIDGWVGILCVLISPDNQDPFGFDKDNQNYNNGDFEA